MYYQLFVYLTLSPLFFKDFDFKPPVFLFFTVFHRSPALVCIIDKKITAIWYSDGIRLHSHKV